MMGLNQVINDLREKLAKAESERDALAAQVEDLEDSISTLEGLLMQGENKAAAQIIAAHDAEVAARAIEDALDACRHAFNYGEVPVSQLVDYVDQLRAKAAP